jgi:lysophospholipase L1-like esterase
MTLSGKIRRGLAVFAVTFISLLTPFEVYLRVFGDVETVDDRRQASVTYFYDGYTGVRPRPNQQIRRESPENPGAETLVEMNGRGYRSEADFAPRPEGVTRIVILGGSQVWDLYADNNQDWPHLVGVNLNANGHPDVEVINAGVPGYNSSQSLALLQFEIWLFEPDFVVVDHCWNDIKYFNRIDDGRSLITRSSRPENRQDSALFYVSSLDRLLGHSLVYQTLREPFRLWRTPARAEGVQPSDARASTVHDLGVRQYELTLSAIVDFSRQIGAQPVLVVQPRLVHANNGPDDMRKIGYQLVGLSHQGLLEAFSRCDAVIRGIATREDLAVIDASGVMSGSTVYFLDHVHTTSAGSQRLADVVAQSLGELLSVESPINE